jgi:putative nucleotidyltransferase with HDIG domain
MLPILNLKPRQWYADMDNHQAEPGGYALARAPSRPLIAAEVLALAGAALLCVLENGNANWNLPLFFTLLALAIAADVMDIETRANIKMSGSFLALVIAMVFLGGTPAAIIGAATIVVDGVRSHKAAHYFLNNLVSYVWFPLIGGIAFHGASEALGVDDSDGVFYLLVFGVFLLALAVNFTIIAAYSCYLERTRFVTKVRKAVIPILSSELFAAVLAVGVAYFYGSVGIAAIALFAIVLFIFQYLLGELLVSEERAEELQARSRQLASLQVGLLSALLHTLDLRDRMTARHSAAVARYAKEIARAAGYSEQDQDLVHTAGLLHDIGKFVFPDRILKGNHKLTEEDWQIIRTHPEQGAQLVSQIEGYGPVGDIILAHHERIDGDGYPRGLLGDEIPALSRMISVADIYDVMTARDSYRKPISSFEAITELRRVAGKQVDAHFVEVFVEVLAGKDVRYRHGEDADFDAELGLDKRVHEYAAPVNAKNGRNGSDPEPAEEVEETPEAAEAAEAAEATETAAASDKGRSALAVAGSAVVGALKRDSSGE